MKRDQRRDFEKKHRPIEANSGCRIATQRTVSAILLLGVLTATGELATLCAAGIENNPAECFKQLVASPKTDFHGRFRKVPLGPIRPDTLAIMKAHSPGATVEDPKPEFLEVELSGTNFLYKSLVSFETGRYIKNQPDLTFLSASVRGTNYWMEKGRAYVGAVGDQSAEHFSDLSYQQNVRYLANFGVGGVEPGSVKWEGNTMTATQTGAVAIKVIGVLTLTTTGTPSSLTLSRGDGTPYFRLEYSYNEPEHQGQPLPCGVPTSYRQISIRNGQEYAESRMEIHDYTTGGGTPAIASFNPKENMNGLWVTDIFTYKNRDLFEVHSDGELTKVGGQ